MSQPPDPNNPYYQDPGQNPNSGGPPLLDEQIRHKQVSALIPEKVGRGVFSTGAIVTQGNYEFVIDFLQNLTRPHAVSARIIMNPNVVGQWINVLRDNLGKYETRFGKLPPLPGAGPQTMGPQPHPPANAQSAAETPPSASQEGSRPEDPSAADRPPMAGDSDRPAKAGSPDRAESPGQEPNQEPTERAQDAPSEVSAQEGAAQESAADQPAAEEGAASEAPAQGTPSGEASPAEPAGTEPPGPASQPQQPVAQAATQTNRPSIQEVYEDLKLPEEIMSGSYANAVMVGHAVGEFYFDFITNFFPRSAVCCRVFLSARQIPRLLDALTVSYQRYQRRLLEAQQRLRQQQQSSSTPFQAWPNPPSGGEGGSQGGDSPNPPTSDPGNAS